MPQRSQPVDGPPSAGHMASRVSADALPGELVIPGARVPPPAGREAVGDVPIVVPDSSYVRLVKPVLDFSLGFVLVLLLVPVLLVIAVAVRLSMGSPIIFRQDRVGRDGEPFVVYKFRTMIPDRRASLPSSYSGPERRHTHKTPDDPRITSVGRFLRRWSLDELPQLVNVVLGHMSLVGPRPELVQIVERYEPWQHNRHVVKPGITGLWQTSARHNGPMHEHVEIDIDYIVQVSLRTDLSILLRTVPVLFGKLRGY